MNWIRTLMLATIVFSVWGCFTVPPTRAGDRCVIVSAVEDSPVAVLAAREVRRYVYLRSGQLLPIVSEPPAGADTIVIQTDTSLKPQQYTLKTTSQSGRKVLAITGGTDVAALYGAYHFAQTLGVRFYVHGDVIPDRKIAFAVPDLDETHEPLFELRGIQPFHDFTEGPDWWSLDDYKAYLSQLAKLRMNWIGFHCYPEGGVGPEPLVWIGRPDDVNADGTVEYAYPSRWASTSGGSWGYSPTKTSDFAAGAGLLFAGDDFGSPVTDGYRPVPQTAGASNAVFNRAGAFFNEAFSYARTLGIKTCIGTETPLQIPSAVRRHLEREGMDPNDPATVRQLYTGMFTRIARTHPLDYYWLWTPEGWTWSGIGQQQIDKTVADIKLALEALAAAGNPFGFATCGWVLGPPSDRALFDKTLPKDVAVSCINRQVGFTPVEPGFAAVVSRPQWAIPWVEDDPAMVIPQLWAGRLRRDAADAHAYGCTGLMGIHWRTKVLAPNFAALAAAAWDQSGWNADFGTRIVPPKGKDIDVYIGGSTASYPNPIAGTNDDPVYQTCRWNVSAYLVKIPSGTYSVTLKFCEVAYGEKGKRVFGVKLQGKQVVDKLDVFARVGKNTALDFTFDDVEVTDDKLAVEFVPEIEHPFIAAIVVNGTTKASNQFAARPFTRKINCGAGSYQDYQADLAPRGTVPFPDKPRDLPCDDFYRDWCRANFGPEAAGELAALFTSLDGGPGQYHPSKATTLPRPANWIGGPGGIAANGRPWDQEKQRYAFVDRMAALREKIAGAGNLARFDYWLNTFRYLRAVGQMGCTRGALGRIIKQIDETADAAKKKELAEQQALPLRLKLARQWEEMMTHQLAATDTIGEIGTIANLEMHVRRNTNAPHLLTLHDQKLAAWLGDSLPDRIHPGNAYRGQPRLVVPTVRTVVEKGERLTVKVIVLDKKRCDSAVLRWRPLGEGRFRPIDLTRAGRGAYTVTLPPAESQSFEYNVEARTAGGQKLVWPASAPALNQTVVVMPAKPKQE